MSTIPQYRMRYKDNRICKKAKATSDVWDKYYVGCAGSASWRTYSTWTGDIWAGKYETMSDVVTPRYQKASREGSIIMSPMEHNWVEVTDGGGATPETTTNTPACVGSGEYKPRYRWPFEVVSAGLYWSRFRTPSTAGAWLPAHTMLLDQSQYASMLTEVATCVHNKRGRVGSNLFESIAQADKLISLLPSLFTAIAQTAKRNAGKLKRLQGVSAAYLIYRYGITPLVSDVQQVLGALAVIEGKIRETSRCNISAETSAVTLGSDVHGGSVPFTWSISSRETVTIRAMSLDEYYLTQIASAGLTLKNLATVGWELLPFSFVLDWFANLGDYFGAISPTPLITNRGACWTVRRERVDVFQITGCNAPSGFTLDVPIVGSATKTSVAVARSPTLPSPGLVIKSDFRFDKLTRVGDALALATTVFGGLLNRR